MVLPRFAWRRLFKQRLVLLLIVFSLIWPIVCACYIYLANHAELLAGLPRNFQNYAEVNGDSCFTFMVVQAVFAIFLAALAGPGLIAPDLSNNALPLYFSRPLTRSDYILARLVVLFGLLARITLIPGLLLFGLQVGMAGGWWFWAHWTLGLGMMLGFSLWILVVSMVALAASAYVKWRIVAGAVVLGFFWILKGAAAMINVIFRVTWAHAINPSWTVDRLWCAILGVEPPEGPGLAASAVATAVTVLLLLLILRRKLRPVEVVS
jgi:ABC-2 type transport system permease protein